MLPLGHSLFDRGTRLEHEMDCVPRYHRNMQCCSSRFCSVTFVIDYIYSSSSTPGFEFKKMLIFIFTHTDDAVLSLAFSRQRICGYNKVYKFEIVTISDYLVITI